jgi:ribonuclease III
MRPNSSHTGKRRRQRARGADKPPTLEPEARELVIAAVGRRFKDPLLLDRAFTHRSAVPGKASEWSNERLEFLGDRVLGLIVAGMLLERHPDAREGELAPRLNALVSREACAVIGEALGFADLVIAEASGPEERRQGRATLVANAVEAVLGAVYLDGGLEAARGFVRRAWASAFAAADNQTRDPKTALQEHVQGRGWPAPSYAHVRLAGPDHAPRFGARVSVGAELGAEGEGGSKQEAERAAARAMLDHLTGDPR